MWIESSQPSSSEDSSSTEAVQGEDLVLHLHTTEVALLMDIFEAALPTERISGLNSHNPALTHFFNSVYGGLISTARRNGWGSSQAGVSQR